jgi:methylmalonyl-CoA/ethylmalonyl-CoA epimerase
MSPSSPALGPIGQIALTVSDVPKSVEFYQNAVGLRLLFQAPPSLAFFDCGGIRLMLSPPEKDFGLGSGSIIYFKISDIEGVQRAMQSRGVSFIDDPHLIAKMPDHELWMCFFRDPDGNGLALMEEKR